MKLMNNKHKIKFLSNLIFILYTFCNNIIIIDKNRDTFVTFSLSHKKYFFKLYDICNQSNETRKNKDSGFRLSIIRIIQGFYLIYEQKDYVFHVLF